MVPGGCQLSFRRARHRRRRRVRRRRRTKPPPYSLVLEGFLKALVRLVAVPLREPLRRFRIQFFLYGNDHLQAMVRHWIFHSKPLAAAFAVSKSLSTAWDEGKEESGPVRSDS